MRLIQAITGSAFLIFSGLCCVAKYIGAAIRGGDISFLFLQNITPVALSVAMYGSLFVGLLLIILSLGIMEKSKATSKDDHQNK